MTQRGGVDGMCTLHAVSVVCFCCRHQTRISRGGFKRGSSAFYYSVCLVWTTLERARNYGSDKISALISLKFEISRQLERSRECMEQVKELVLMGHNLD